MFKVVFVLRQIVLRLKESEIEVVVKKQKDTVLLGSSCKIIDGICNLNQTTQFYLAPNDPTLNIQVLILQGNNRKLGGITVLNLIQWEPNVIHQSISVLTNCPDNQARIFYNFYYFKDSSVTDKRHLFLTSNRFRDECDNIQKRNILLTLQNKALEKELNQHEKRNETLMTMKKQSQLNFIQIEKVHREEIGNRQRNIDICSQQYQASKEMREQLQELVKQKGFKMKQDD